MKNIKLTILLFILILSIFFPTYHVKAQLGNSCGKFLLYSIVTPSGVEDLELDSMIDVEVALEPNKNLFAQCGNKIVFKHSWLQADRSWTYSKSTPKYSEILNSKSGLASGKINYIDLYIDNKKVDTATITIGKPDFTPKNIVVCKLSDTSSKINWTTKSKINSALEYSLQGQSPTADQQKWFNTLLTQHSITLSGLTKGSTYGYVIYQPVAGQTTMDKNNFVKGPYQTFVAGDTHDAKNCKADGSSSATTSTGVNPVDNTAKPADTLLDVNTNIKIDTNNINFDQSLGTFFNPLKFDRPEALVLAIINLLLLIAGVLSIIFIIFGGIRMVTSGGNETAVTSGKKIITWAVLGLIVCILSFSIVAVISSLIS